DVDRVGEDARRPTEPLGGAREAALVDIAEPDAPAGLVERLRDAEADARGGAGNEHDLVGEVGHITPPAGRSCRTVCPRPACAGPRRRRAAPSPRPRSP